MKITHLCLMSRYTDGLTYQDNMLSLYHKRMGFEVDVIASTQMYENGVPIDTGIACDYYDSNGVHVYRVKYRHPTRVDYILKRFIGLTAVLVESCPDILFIHGLGMMADKEIGEYISSRSELIVYADSHADYYNSARSPLAKEILHRRIWRHYIGYIDPFIKKYFGVSQEAIDFICDLYKIDPERVDYLPLGADDHSLPDRQSSKEDIKAQYDIPLDHLTIVTGGKLDEGKGVLELMTAFKELDLENATLLIFGSVEPAIENTFQSLVGENVRFIGWIPGWRTNEMLSGADLGVFPGTQSALWMQAIVCGLPCVFKKWERGNSVDLGGNCRFIRSTNSDEISRAILEALASLDSMKAAAQTEARFRYGYSRIARVAIGLNEAN